MESSQFTWHCDEPQCSRHSTSMLLQDEQQARAALLGKRLVKIKAIKNAKSIANLESGRLYLMLKVNIS
jgi:hypothetical protein